MLFYGRWPNITEQIAADAGGGEQVNGEHDQMADDQMEDDQMEGTTIWILLTEPWMLAHKQKQNDAIK